MRRFLMALIWAGIFTSPIGMLGFFVAQLALNGEERREARELLVAAFPITFILGYCVGMLGLLPGTKRIVRILVRTSSHETIGVATARAERVNRHVFRILPADATSNVA